MTFIPALKKKKGITVAEHEEEVSALIFAGTINDFLEPRDKTLHRINLASSKSGEGFGTGGLC